MGSQAATSTERRTERLEARIPAELKEVFARAAALRGQTLTDFVLATVTEAAQRVIREQEMIRLSERDQVAFAQALMNPPEPSPKLQAVVRRYRHQVGL